MLKQFWKQNLNPALSRTGIGKSSNNLASVICKGRLLVYKKGRGADFYPPAKAYFMFYIQNIIPLIIYIKGKIKDKGYGGQVATRSARPVESRSDLYGARR